LLKLHQKVVFLDRDGVINQDSPDYIKSWSEFHFLPGSLDALSRLTRQGFQLIVITNQSVLNRQMVPIEILKEIHSNMREEIRRHGGEITDVFYCPHRPDEGCKCRKPAPGLIHLAARSHRIDLRSAAMIGDSAKDIECARNAGCGYSILVQTGNGIRAHQELSAKGIQPDHIATTLSTAVDWILAEIGHRNPTL
jgi:D-glycero-D-manno-heptose 1,7-bisphosphate phosphatase